MMRSVHLPLFAGRPSRVLDRLGPANLVTLVRTFLVLVVAVLALVTPDGRWPITLLATAALVLDGVDGWVARRTGTVSPVGARFDMEVDAILVLVLAVHVAERLGLGWVLFIGAARYLLALAVWIAPWMGTPVPQRYWRKVVAVAQVVTLLVVGAGLLPHAPARLALGVAGLALAVSFLTQVWEVRAARPSPSRRRTVVGALLAVAVAWAALAAPSNARLGVGSMGQLPLEAVVAGVLFLLLRGRTRTVLAAAAAGLLAVLVVVKGADIGFRIALGRPFDPPTDLSYAGSAVGLARDSLGPVVGTALVVAAVLVVVGLAAGVWWAGWRSMGLVTSHRGPAARLLVAAAVAWVAAAGLGLRSPHGTPVATTANIRLASTHVTQFRAGLADRPQFARLIAADPLAGAGGSAELTALGGKDVLVVFVESYGRYAVEGSPVAPGVTDVLRRGDAELADDGFGAKSGYLLSPTFGGISWLAHSTLESGLWVDTQSRYDQLLASSRTTLSGLFGTSGWRTVCDVPANRHDWPPATSFYHCDQTYDARNIGYRGPAFGYPPVPDQYTLTAFARDELQPGHAPVMAEIDLVTSHAPWSPLPPTLPASSLGDGTAYTEAASPAAAPRGSRTAYGNGIEYSLTSLFDFVKDADDPNLVLVVLGDHQPSTTVSGLSASHDVPISVIAHDPAVLSAIDSWGWTPGLLPATDAPVWPMDTFRGRFLDAYRNP